MKNILILSFGIFLVATLQAQQVHKVNETELAHSLVWKIIKSDLKDTSYLLGTIHLPLQKAFSAVDTVETILEVVDRAYFELKYDPLSFASQGMFFIAQHDSEKVKHILNPEEYQLLKSKAEEVLQGKALVVDMLKPIGILSMFTIAMTPVDTVGPMDVLLQEAAKKKGVKVGGLETAEQQIEVLKKMTITQQKEELLDLINNFDLYTSQIDSLIQAYLQHDLAALKRLTDEGFSVSSHEFKKELLTKRNIQMGQKIESYASKHSCLFAIGAAHLIGEEGLIFLLRERGFELIPLYQK